MRGVGYRFRDNEVGGSRLRSIRVRLALIFSSITLTAIAGIYLYVAPQLESRLRDEKLDGLARDAALYSRDLHSRQSAPTSTRRPSTGPCARPPTGPAPA